MLDKQNMLGSIRFLGEQMKETFKGFPGEKLPPEFSSISQIAVFGMGGSALGADLIKNIFAAELKVPLLVINDYRLPAWVNKKTLAILSSYSGNTEETLTIAKKIYQKTKKVFIITTGGQLRRYLKHGYIINPHFNPCQQPRMGLGYALASLLALFRQLKLLKPQKINFQSYAKEAKNLSQKLKNRVPVIIASEHLAGNAHVLANQINENAKSFACYFLLPEMNHHLIAGLRFSSENLFFIFLISEKYYSRNKLRYQITQRILQKQKIKFGTIKFEGQTKLDEALSALSFGSYLSYYLALSYQIDPSPIPWVDYLKKQL